MKVSLSWMRRYAPLDASLDSLRATLEATGTEVDRARVDAAGTVVARVVGLEGVPEKTRKPLTLVELDAGGGEPVRLVTAATNLHVGALVPWAPPGTLLPGWDEPLGTRVMLGRYPSPGMLLSDEELALGETADGIRILDRGTPGQPIEELLTLDAVLDVEVTTNRPDCLCHVGLARELAAALGEPLTPPPAAVPDDLLSASSMDGRVTVAIEPDSGCTRFAARIVENVAVGPTPAEMARQLRAAGVRPISNAVDVTNWVALELGEPMHAFDLDRLRQVAGLGPGRPLALTVRRARAGETLHCLDGVDRMLDPADVVIAAGATVVSLAGVMGGQATAVDADTRTVLLEAATWDRSAVRATSRRHGLRSEASSRFEKGLPAAIAAPALERGAALLAELSGGRVLRGVVDEHPGAVAPAPPITVAHGAMEAVLGYHVDLSDAGTALVRLGFLVEQLPGALVVTPPPFRTDVTIAVDVVEEIGRMLGYDRVPATLHGRRVAAEGEAEPPVRDDAVRDLCAGAGFDEVLTWSFTSEAVQAATAALAAVAEPLRVRNALSAEWAVMRLLLLPGVAAALGVNQRHGAEVIDLFEIGRVFHEGRRTSPPDGARPDDDGLPPLPGEPVHLCLVSQSGDTGADSSAVAIRRLQAVLASAADELGGCALTVDQRDLPGLRPGRAAVLRAGETTVGFLGELDDDLLATLDLRGRVAVAEVDVDVLLAGWPAPPRLATPPRFPAVDRELTVVVPAVTRAGEVLATARNAGGPLLATVEIVDDYRGPGIPDGTRALSLRLAVRAADRTLTGAEGDAVRTAVLAALSRDHGAEERR